ncbi:hypothetical protein IW262DRAFT_1459037 [Armillaria fumosa]|nr:hypothetical protein IW262DRAFT_1459037 [Armillaria fumosa]
MSSASETPNLTEDTSIVFTVLNSYFNGIIVFGLMHGIYTCIFAITLRNIFSRRVSRRDTSRILMVFVILGFIDNGQDIPSVFTALTSFNSQWTITQIDMGVAATISTVISGGTLIWRCFIVWGYRWLVVIFPILCLITETVAKCFQIYQGYRDNVESASLAN